MEHLDALEIKILTIECVCVHVRLQTSARVRRMLKPACDCSNSRAISFISLRVARGTCVHVRR